MSDMTDAERILAAQIAYAQAMEAIREAKRAREAARKKSTDPRAKAAYDRHLALLKSLPKNKQPPTIKQGRYISQLLGGMDAFCPGRDQRYPDGFVTCAEALYDMGLTKPKAEKFLSTVERKGIERNREACRALLSDMGVTCPV